MADQPRSPGSEHDTGDYPGAPRWVKITGIIVLIVVLLLVIKLFTGGPDGHGPGRHRFSNAAGEQKPPSGVTAVTARPAAMPMATPRR